MVQVRIDAHASELAPAVSDVISQIRADEPFVPIVVWCASGEGARSLSRAVSRTSALFDVQFLTSHLASMGAYEISRPDYLERLARAQTARGVPFDEGGALKRARRLGRLLVPIFIGGFARADVLTTAMNTRCYRGGRYRTKLRQMHASLSDLLALTLVIAWITAAWLV